MRPTSQTTSIVEEEANYEFLGTGLCRGSDGSVPPNYSRNGITFEECESQCSAEILCLGYSYSTSEVRCALFLNMEFEDMVSSLSWTAYSDINWIVENNVQLDSVNYAPQWECYNRLVWEGGDTTTTETPSTTVFVVEDYEYVGNGLCSG
eukprot:UN29144